MANIRPLALGTQSNKGYDPLEGVARLINCRVEVTGEGLKRQFIARATPGLASVGSFSGTGGVRSALDVDGIGLAVVGRTIQQFNAGGSALVLGGIPSQGWVGMARNARQAGTQTLIVCDGLGKYVQGGSVIDVTDTDFGTPIDVACVGNHFVTIDASGYLRASEINDATDWDNLAIAGAQANPDGGMRVIARGKSVLAFGPRSFEEWAYSGANTGLPFAFQSATDIGCYAAGSVIAAPVVTKEIVASSIAWASTDPYGSFAGVVLMDGTTPRKISTHSVDRDFRRCADPSTIRATSYTMDGHAYICWTIPDVTTWAYNTATGLWHELVSYDLNHWRVGAITVIGNTLLAGDRDSPTLYRIDGDVHTEGSDPHVMTIQTPTLHAFPDPITMHALYLDCVTGVGLNTTTPANLDPSVSMSISRDGATFGTEISRALGRQGQTRKRVSWHGLGSADERGAVFRLSCSAAVVRSFMAASLCATKGRA